MPRGLKRFKPWTAKGRNQTAARLGVAAPEGFPDPGFRYVRWPVGTEQPRFAVVYERVSNLGTRIDSFHVTEADALKAKADVEARAAYRRVLVVLVRRAEEIET